MIQSFRNRNLKRFWETGSARRLPCPEYANTVRVILLALDAAQHVRDMDLPTLRFHGLGQMDPGRYACRVGGPWRVSFAWSDAGPTQLDVENYHRGHH